MLRTSGPEALIDPRMTPAPLHDSGYEVLDPTADVVTEFHSV